MKRGMHWKNAFVYLCLFIHWIGFGLDILNTYYYCLIEFIQK